MKVFIYSDIHGQKLFLPEEEPDLVILLGDIHWRDVKIIDNHFKCEKLGVLGNHDVLDTFKNTNIIDMHENNYEFNGVSFAGFGGCARYNNKYNVAQYEEYEADKFVRGISGVDVFLAHSNPSTGYSSDLTDPHRGFLSFEKLLNDNRVKMFLHGHIHENSEIFVGKSKVISTYGFREYIISF